jgi:dihydrofolate synthase/folylpolyglutamate synthase
MSVLTYAEALGLLEQALSFGINPSLDGIRTLTTALGVPQDAFRSMQVTGTNGKTSVTRIAAALLSAHGQRTGAYTSPHLVAYTERFVVDGTSVDEDEFAAAIVAVMSAVEDTIAHHAETLGLGTDAMDLAYTEFELLTAAALRLFRERGCMWACLEVGMGGRWDATSVVSPEVAVITGVGLDHTDRLGATREEIAADKAHIIKPGSVAVLGPGCQGVEDILLRRVTETDARVVRVGLGDQDVAWRVTVVPDRPGGEMRMDVYGVHAVYDGLSVTAPSYQAPNVATAVAAVEVALGRALEPDTVRAALAGLSFPGRFELLSEAPAVVIDGAHNHQAAQALASAIVEAFGHRSPIAVLGVLRDKDAEGIVRALAPAVSAFVCTRNESPRSLSPEELAGVVERVTGKPVVTGDSVESALEIALGKAADAQTGVVVTGSLYTAGLARALLG